MVHGVRGADVDVDAEKFDPGMLPPDVLESIEADSFWCLSALLDGIQVPHPINYNTDVSRIIIFSHNRGFKGWSRRYGN